MTGDGTTSRRAKRTGLLGLVAGAGLTMFAWSQVWFTFSVSRGLGGDTAGEARGDTAAPALLALALTGLAGVAGLALAGPVFRVLLGALEALLGAVVVLQSIIALANPLGAVAPVVSTLTGVAGDGGTADLVVDGSLAGTVWPWVGLVGGIVIAAAGAYVCATARRWPGSSRKYGARFEDESGAPVTAAPAPGDDRVDQWDALTHGDDPTDAEPADDPAPEAGTGTDSDPATGETGAGTGTGTGAPDPDRDAPGREPGSGAAGGAAPGSHRDR